MPTTKRIIDAIHARPATTKLDSPPRVVNMNGAKPAALAISENEPKNRDGA